MIHITRAKGGFMVVTLAKNRQPLATSEILKARRSAITNIAAQLSFFGKKYVAVQDDTRSKPVRLIIYRNGEWIYSGLPTVKPYVPKKKRK